jgi:hypothetical protein
MKGHTMTTDQLLIKIKALDLLIDEVLIDITNDDTLAATDESCEADKAASLLQDYLDKFKTMLQQRTTNHELTT